MACERLTHGRTIAATVTRARLDHRRVRGHPGRFRLPAGLHRRGALLRRVRTWCIPRNSPRSSSAAARVLLAVRARVRADRRAARPARSSRAGWRVSDSNCAARCSSRASACSTACSARRSARRWVWASSGSSQPWRRRRRARPSCARISSARSILRELNQLLPPTGLDPERARAAGSIAVNRRAPRRMWPRRCHASRTLRACGRPRAASCACSAPPAGWRSRARAGWRSRAWW